MDPSPAPYQATKEQTAAIENSFSYHAPHGDQAIRYESIRAKARALGHTLTMFCPASRELSLALTHLQEAMMWANAAIACREPDPREAPSVAQADASVS